MDSIETRFSLGLSKTEPSKKIVHEAKTSTGGAANNELQGFSAAEVEDFEYLEWSVKDLINHSIELMNKLDKLNEENIELFHRYAGMENYAREL